MASRRAHLESELLHREEEHRQLEGRLLESLASADGAWLKEELWENLTQSYHLTHAYLRTGSARR